mgnify:FL=1
MAILLCACNRNESYESLNVPATRSATDVLQGTMIHTNMKLYNMLTDSDGNLHACLGNYSRPVKYTKSTARWNYAGNWHPIIVYGNNITGLALNPSGNYLAIYDGCRLIELDQSHQFVAEYTQMFPSDMYFVGVAAASNGNIFVSMSETLYGSPSIGISEPIILNPGEELKPPAEPEPVYHTIYRLNPNNLNVVQIADEIEVGYTNDRALNVSGPALLKPYNGYLYGPRLDGGYYRVGTTGTQLGQVTYHSRDCIVLSYAVAADNNWIYMLTMEENPDSGGKQMLTPYTFKILEVRPNGVENVVGKLVNYPTTYYGNSLTEIGWPAYETFSLPYAFTVNSDATEFYAMNRSLGYQLPELQLENGTDTLEGLIGTLPDPGPKSWVSRVIQMTF